MLPFPSNALEADVSQRGRKEISHFYVPWVFLGFRTWFCKHLSCYLCLLLTPLLHAHHPSPWVTVIAAGWAYVCLCFVPFFASPCAILIRLAFSLMSVLWQGDTSISATKTDRPEPSFSTFLPCRDQLHLYCSFGSLSLPSVIFQNSSSSGFPPNTNVSNNQGSQKDTQLWLQDH